MKRTAVILGFVATVALAIGGGLLHGWMTGRWGPPPAMLAAGQRLMELPTRIGPWNLLESRDFDESTLRELEPAGYVERTYVHQDTGERIGMMLVVGAVGPISVHTPEVCVSNQAYEISEKTREVTIPLADGASHRVWTVAFRSRGVEGHGLRMYYAWSTGGPWLAPEDARYFFAGNPYLYKVQVSAQASPRAASATSDVGQRFLRDLIPAAQKYLIDSQSK